MYKIYWVPDKQKDGEQFTNSICFVYCLKHFIAENRLELWDKGAGYQKVFRTVAGASFEYRYIKSLHYQEMMNYIQQHFERK